MGEYTVDWNANEIVVDGHKCKKVEEGVYAVQDRYMVNAYEWKMDKRNTGLRAFAIYNGENALHEVLFVCKPVGDCIINGSRRMPKDKTKISLFCVYSDEDYNMSWFGSAF